MVDKKLVYFSCAFGSRASNLPYVSHEVRMMTTIQPTGTVLVSQSFVCKGWVFCHTTEDPSMETKCAATLITSNPPGKMKNCRFCSTSIRSQEKVPGIPDQATQNFQPIVELTNQRTPSIRPPNHWQNVAARGQIRRRTMPSTSGGRGTGIPTKPVG